LGKPIFPNALLQERRPGLLANCRSGVGWSLRSAAQTLNGGKLVCRCKVRVAHDHMHGLVVKKLLEEPWATSKGASSCCW